MGLSLNGSDVASARLATPCTASCMSALRLASAPRPAMQCGGTRVIDGRAHCSAHQGMPAARAARAALAARAASCAPEETMMMRAPGDSSGSSAWLMCTGPATLTASVCSNVGWSHTLGTRMPALLICVAWCGQACERPRLIKVAACMQGCHAFKGCQIGAASLACQQLTRRSICWSYCCLTASASASMLLLLPESSGSTSTLAFGWLAVSCAAAARPVRACARRRPQQQQVGSSGRTAAAADEPQAFLSAHLPPGCGMRAARACLPQRAACLTRGQCPDCLLSPVHTWPPLLLKLTAARCMADPCSCSAEGGDGL